MIIFALDCAKKTAGVAISHDGKLLYEDCTEKVGTHSETLLCMCHDAFTKTGISPGEIDLFAVTSGPGSFTGLRIGISIIKGLAFAQNKPCAAVSTLEALAMSAECGIVASVLDARRNHVYGALFQKSESGLLRLTQDDILPAEQFCEIAVQATQKYNYCNRIICMGDGAPLIEKNNLFVVPDEKTINGTAYAITKCALNLYTQNKCTTADMLVPVYLRPTLAERSLLKKENN